MCRRCIKGISKNCRKLSWHSARIWIWLASLASSSTSITGIRCLWRKCSETVSRCGCWARNWSMKRLSKLMQLISYRIANTHTMWKASLNVKSKNPSRQVWRQQVTECSNTKSKSSLQRHSKSTRNPKRRKVRMKFQVANHQVKK